MIIVCPWPLYESLFVEGDNSPLWKSVTSISLSPYSDTSVYPLHAWNVLLNLTVCFEAIEGNCSKELLEIWDWSFFCKGFTQEQKKWQGQPKKYNIFFWKGVKSFNPFTLKRLQLEWLPKRTVHSRTRRIRMRGPSKNSSQTSHETPYAYKNELGDVFTKKSTQILSTNSNQHCWKTYWTIFGDIEMPSRRRDGIERSLNVH